MVCPSDSAATAENRGGICMFSTDRYHAVFPNIAVTIVSSINNDLFWLYHEQEI